MQIPDSALIKRAIAAIVAVLAVIGGTVLVIDTDGPGPLPAHTVTIPKTIAVAPPATAVDGPDADTKRDDALPLSSTAQAALERAATATAGDLSGPLREPGDNQKPGVIQGPLAAQEWPGCRTRFVRNFSARTAEAELIVWHQTVSRDRRGWADQDALTALANNPRSEVSWAFLIGRLDGLCTYTVPLQYKAWTQGNANSVAIGIEVQAYGDEPRYVEPAGERKLLAVTRRIGKLRGIPMQRGRFHWERGCRIVVDRPGIVQHSDLGSCAGGHADVTPWSIEPLIAKAAAGSVTATDRVTCRKLNAWRRAGRPHGKAEANAVRRKRALTARRVACTTRGPVKV